MTYVIELPDEHGHISRPPHAIVLVRRQIVRGSERLIPLQPTRHARRWPEGWNQHLNGGWVEVAGPARLLTAQQHFAIVSVIPQAIKDATGQAKLRLGESEEIDASIVSGYMLTLRTLWQKQPDVFAELERACYSPDCRLPKPLRRVLESSGLIDGIDRYGRVSVVPLVKRLVLSASENGLPISTTR